MWEIPALLEVPVLMGLPDQLALLEVPVLLDRLDLMAQPVPMGVLDLTGVLDPME
jgi:hypothetical protein